MLGDVMVERWLAKKESEKENTQTKDVCFFSDISWLLNQVLWMPDFPTVVNLSYFWGEISLSTFRLTHFSVFWLAVCKIDQLKHVLRIKYNVFKFDV